MKKSIPEEILKHKPNKTTIKVIGNTYFLYSVSSKRVKGIKHPISNQTYIGTINENGVHYKNKQISEDKTIVKEYGFSRFCELYFINFQGELKKVLKSKAEHLFKYIVSNLSTNSYLHEEKQEGINYSYWLSKLIENYGEIIKEIESLKYIYLITYNNTKIISKISEEQEAILRKYRINYG
jgi:hypothetical protein